jgi:hypothetical protein
MKIKIKSSDSFEQNYEKLFELEKIIIVDEKKEYHYKDEYGKCKIVDKIDSIEIYRYGEINFKQIFKKDKNTSFTFITTKFRGKYEIFTKKFEKENGKIMLEYDIIDGNEIINSINLEVQFIDI